MSPAPQTFSWKDFSEWEKFIRDLFPVMIQESVFDGIRNSKEGFKYVDDVAFFAKCYQKFGEYSELVESFLDEFPKRFTFIKMYHCCRPPEIKSYYDLGIRVLNTTEMDAEFKDLFLKNPRFPQITNSYIQAAIEHMAGSYKRHGFVYFGLDDRFLVNHCGHYLIFGSEYLQGLATFVERKIHCDLKSELKKCGKPTVFEVRMPVSYFSGGELRELASEAFQTWAYNIAHNRTYPYELDFGKEINHDLPSDYIIGHYHPKKIPDPSNCFENYCFEEK